jgi:hypothetical protein
MAVTVEEAEAEGVETGAVRRGGGHLSVIRGRVSAMGRRRGEELWVAAMVRAALGRVVLHHDDGSRDGMYDLRLASEGVEGAMEVVAAADAESIEFWNLMNGRDTRWVEEDLDGGWLVVVNPAARVRRLRKELPSLLAALEGAGVARMRTTRHAPGGVDRLAVELGLHSAHQSGTDFKGSIYVTVKRDPEFTVGAVAATGDPLAAWLGEFLNSPSCADVRRKLQASGLDE